MASFLPNFRVPTKEENGWIDLNFQGRNWVFFIWGGAAPGGRNHHVLWLAALHDRQGGALTSKL